MGVAAWAMQLIRVNLPVRPVVPTTTDPHPHECGCAAHEPLQRTRDTAPSDRTSIFRVLPSAAHVPFFLVFFPLLFLFLIYIYLFIVILLIYFISSICFSFLFFVIFILSFIYFFFTKLITLFIFFSYFLFSFHFFSFSFYLCFLYNFFYFSFLLDSN